MNFVYIIIVKNIEKDKYIILELIPSHYKNELGSIIQIQTLKLIDGFDYSLDENLIENKDLLKIISIIFIIK